MTVKCLDCGYIDYKLDITPKGYPKPYFGGGPAKCKKCKSNNLKRVD